MSGSTGYALSRSNLFSLYAPILLSAHEPSSVGEQSYTTQTADLYYLSHMKILNALWFTDMGTSHAIGIVIVDIEGEEQAYIGTSRSTSKHTYDELEDAQWIATRGARFPREVARLLMPLNTIRYVE